MKERTRFYRDVAVKELLSPEQGHCILLDGKELKTPAGAPFIVPFPALAEAIADEWRAQGEKIKYERLKLTRLAQTAIDRLSADRTQFCEQVLAFAKSDLVCYRAETPVELVKRQALVWDPLLKWARTNYEIGLVTTSGVRFIAQPSDALKRMEAVISSYNDFRLAGLHSGATLTGSAIIALALTEGLLDGEQAFEAAAIDDLYQAECWGTDIEAQAVQERKRQELITIAHFFRILTGDQSRFE